MYYVRDVNPEEFFAVIDEQIVSLEQHFELPEEFLRAIPSQLDAILSTPTLTIGGWDNSADGPLVLALAATGQVVSLVAVNPSQMQSLSDTLASIDYWLSSMTLPNLSELSGNTVEFYEGLLDLSPHSSIVLSQRRRFVLITAVESLDTSGVEARLPDADIDVHYLDVLRAHSGPAIIRQRTSEVAPALPPAPKVPVLSNEADRPTVTSHEPQPTSKDVVPTPAFSEIPNVEVAPITSPDEVAVLQPIDLTDDDVEHEVSEVAEEVDVSYTADIPQSAEFTVGPDADEVLDLTDSSSDATIDLNEPIEPPTLGTESTLPHLRSGGTYELDVLPLLFDDSGDSLQSISNELFSTDNAMVLVATLPERRRDTPFEDRRRFRWDTSLEKIQLLNEHGFTAAGDRRVVHLFVESDRQPGYAVYVGELSRTAFQTQTQIDGETAWFSISPSLDSDLYRLLRKGRLPQHAVV